MMHTEEEAAELWCPYVRAVDGPGDASNRVRVAYTNTDATPSDRPYWARCIASKCMAWRWAQKPNPEWKPRDGMSMTLGYGIDTRNDPPMYVDDTTRGYCGLAGRS